MVSCGVDVLLVSAGKQPTGYDWENGHVHSAVSEAMRAKIEEAQWRQLEQSAKLAGRRTAAVLETR